MFLEGCKLTTCSSTCNKIKAIELKKQVEKSNWKNHGYLSSSNSIWKRVIFKITNGWMLIASNDESCLKCLIDDHQKR